MTQSIEPTTAIRTAIQFGPLSRLAGFAMAGHGFGNSDCGFGVQYPADQDEDERTQYGAIPPGFLRLYGEWGPPVGYELEVPERLYVEILAQTLDEKGMTELACELRNFLANHF